MTTRVLNNNDEHPNNIAAECTGTPHTFRDEMRPLSILTLNWSLPLLFGIGIWHGTRRLTLSLRMRMEFVDTPHWETREFNENCRPSTVDTAHLFWTACGLKAALLGAVPRVGLDWAGLVRSWDAFFLILFLLTEVGTIGSNDC